MVGQPRRGCPRIRWVKKQSVVARPRYESQHYRAEFPLPTTSAHTKVGTRGATACLLFEDALRGGL